MLLLLVDANVEFRRVLEGVLSGGGIRVDGHSDPASASKAHGRSPADLILVDLPPQVGEVDRFLSEVRQGVSGANVPIILMSEVYQKTSNEVSRMLKEHQLQEFLQRPFEMFGLADQLKRVIAQGGPTLQTPSTQPRRPSAERRRTSAREARKPHREHTKKGPFQLIVDVWLRQKTGVLRRSNEDNWVCVNNGEVEKPEDLRFVQAGLRAADLTFHQTHQDTESQGRILESWIWEEAQSRIALSFEFKMERRALVVSPITRRAQDLPLSAATKKLLSAADSYLETGELLRNLGLSPQAVARQIGALEIMGLVSLEPVQSPSGTSRVHSSAPRATAPGRPLGTVEDPPSQPPGPSPKQVLLRLKNEQIRLQGQDPYTLLGIAPDSPDEMLRNAAERMIQRYSKLSKDPALPTEAQKIAADLQHLMERAEARLLNERENQHVQEEQVPAPPPTDVKSTEELAFSEGSKAFAAGNFQRATQCFKKARDERIDSVRNLCWLGWAIFHNQEMAADQREEEALDMLRLANSFDPKHSQACFFLAYVERELGETDKAEARLVNLLRHHEDHREAKKLLRSIQRKKKR